MLFKYLFLFVFVAFFIACSSDDDNATNSGNNNDESRDVREVVYGPLQGVWRSPCLGGEGTEEVSDEGSLRMHRRVEGTTVRVEFEAFSDAHCNQLTFSGWVDYEYEIGDDVQTPSGHTAKQIELTMIDESLPGMAQYEKERDIFKIVNDSKLYRGIPSGDPMVYPTDLMLDDQMGYTKL